MRYAQPAWRIFVSTIALLAILALLTVAAVRVHVHILRHYAEALLADVRSINLRQTTFEEVQPILRRWQRWGTYDGPCTRERCILDVWLSDPNSRFSTFLSHHDRLLDLLSHLGPRRVAIRARFSVLSGRVWSEGMWVWIEAPSTFVAGETISASRIESAYLNPPWRQHPDYAIFWANNLPNLIQLWFTPFADPADVHRLMSMNFSCLTRWSPCRNKAEFMAAAMSRVAYWSSLPEDPNEWNICKDPDPLTLRLLGRDSPNILLVEVVANHPAREKLDRHIFRGHEVAFKVQETLKLRAPGPSPASFAFFFENTISRELSPNAAFRPGAQVILFFKETINRWSLEGCSPLVPTAANMAAIRRGIAEDTRPPGLPRYGLSAD